MYVCICKGITDRQIKEAVYSGTTSVKGLRQRLGLSSQCGSCAELAQELIDETMAGSIASTTANNLFYPAG